MVVVLCRGLRFDFSAPTVLEFSLRAAFGSVLLGGKGGWAMEAFEAFRRMDVWVGACAAMALLLLMAGGAVARPTCRVVDVGGSFATLQEAVDAASSGDT